MPILEDIFCFSQLVCIILHNYHSQLLHGTVIFKYGSFSEGQGIPVNILMDILEFTKICCMKRVKGTITCF